MNSDKLQQPQDENELTELLNSEVDSSVEQTEEVLPKSPNPEIKPKACTWIKPCPTTGNPQGCLVC
ncbi:hypothetical protein RIVM261_038610 [Rivularia sp. IAM M-261]|nr:hypothetical protein CAL7716_077650 [Calothrix sp. PCC 7716]GJD18905.1 hypothetical protein RIVM261_038610 [Rivularia sp. IAM M-261]